MSSQLLQKEKRAIRLLRDIPTDNGPIEICYSGGKDSDVILELAKMSGINYRAIYKATTIDPRGTIKHAMNNGAEIVLPQRTFFEIIRQKGFPSRFARFCCSELKEYKILDRAVQGIRRSESPKRAERYKEPEYCRTYGKGSKAKVYMPILDFTDDDICQFISERKIRCHPLYYDDYDVFHPERRLGCIGCPLASQRKRVEQFKKYPKMLKLWLKNGQIYLDNHRSSQCYKYSRGGSIYNTMFLDLFCKNIDEYDTLLNGGLFGQRIDTKSYLEDTFKIDLSF